ncbi:MAG: c-type cytochrome [Sphingobacteriales bacterium]
MKKIFITLATSAILFSCGGSGDKTEKKDAATSAKEETKAAATNPLEDKAVEIIAKSDCLTCHKINETSTGPAYTDVAKKYENTEANVAMLVEKVTKGGKGNWGQVPMVAHPNLSKEEITTVVQYILTLRNQ